MTQVPQKPLVPDNTLITKTPEEGRALAVMLARNSIHAMQGELETLKTRRAQYAHDPYGLIAASHVIAETDIYSGASHASFSSEMQALTHANVIGISVCTGALFVHPRCVERCFELTRALYGVAVPTK